MDGLEDKLTYTRSAGASSSDKSKLSHSGSQKGIWVGGLADSVKPRDLRELFRDHYTVGNIILKLGANGKPYAYVFFSTNDDAMDACKRFNGTLLQGSKIRVNIKGARPGAHVSSDKRSATRDPTYDVWVGTIPKQATRDDLIDHFARPFGDSVIFARIHQQELPARTYGFVSFDSIENAQNACRRMNGTYLYNSCLTVRMARSANKGVVGKHPSVRSVCDVSSQADRKISGTEKKCVEQWQPQVETTQATKTRIVSTTPSSKVSKDLLGARGDPEEKPVTCADKSCQKTAAGKVATPANFSKFEIKKGFQSKRNVSATGKIQCKRLPEKEINDDGKISAADETDNLHRVQVVGKVFSKALSKDVSLPQLETKEAEETVAPIGAVFNDLSSVKPGHAKKGVPASDTVTKNMLTFQDPLITRLLCSQMLPRVVELANQVSVSVRPDQACKGLILTGSTEAIASLKIRLKIMVEQLRITLVEKLVVLEATMVPVLSVAKVQSEIIRLENEKCVEIEWSDKHVQQSLDVEIDLYGTPGCGKLQLCKAKLTEKSADALVVPIEKDLNFSSGDPGHIENNVLRDTSLHRQLRQFGNPVEYGAVMPLSSESLKCQSVIFVTMPGVCSLEYDLTAFRLSLANVLSEADAMQLQTLAFPWFSFPCLFSTEEAASTMVKAILNHAYVSNQSSLQYVRIFTPNDVYITVLRNALREGKKLAKSMHAVGTLEGAKSSETTPTGIWKYQDDNGLFMYFDSISNAALEKKFLDSSKQVEIRIGPYIYSVDFLSMMQRNKSTGRLRKVTRTQNPLHASNQTMPITCQWVYRGGDGKDHAYDQESNSQMETAWKEGKSDLIVKISGKAYEIDFKSYTQKSFLSGKKREVRREPGNDEISPRNFVGMSENVKSKHRDRGVEQRTVMVKIRGQREDVGAAASDFLSVLDSCVVSRSLPIPSSAYEAYRQEINATVLRLNVILKAQSRQGSSTIVQLDGVDHLVSEAVQCIQVCHALAVLRWNMQH